MTDVEELRALLDQERQRRAAVEADLRRQREITVRENTSSESKSFAKRSLPSFLLVRT